MRPKNSFIWQAYLAQFKSVVVRLLNFSSGQISMVFLTLSDVEYQHQLAFSRKVLRYATFTARNVFVCIIPQHSIAK